ncbi:MAG: N-acetyl-gamma-glutamyl-phosphate reductase [Coriobacteriia bacterium]|nr:N-acetyl-gamma-glutamyl-phosphate reductase [Coriobacteriia bacterium]
MEKYQAAVVGATGFTGVELVSILATHPNFELASAFSRQDSGAQLSDLYPALVERDADITLSPMSDLDGADFDVVFLAVPHTCAMGLVPSLLGSGAKVVDLSADFRLKDIPAFEHWYGVEHTVAELVDRSIYALPELVAHEMIAGAQLISCPGCYPTATALAAAPLLRSTLAKDDAVVIIDAKSGVSGAGRKASLATQFCPVDESVSAYKVAAHQHTPEIEQTLSGVADRPVALTFTPHLIPMKRGILSTVYIACEKDTDVRDVFQLYQDAYTDEPFVQVLALGAQPKTSSVTGTNNAQIGVAFDKRTNIAIITCAIDNLGKGASSQAIQVANIAFGLDQEVGLTAFRSIV